MSVLTPVQEIPMACFSKSFACKSASGAGFLILGFVALGPLHGTGKVDEEPHFDDGPNPKVYESTEAIALLNGEGPWALFSVTVPLIFLPGLNGTVSYVL